MDDKASIPTRMSSELARKTPGRRGLSVSPVGSGASCFISRRSKAAATLKTMQLKHLPNQIFVEGYWIIEVFARLDDAQRYGRSLVPIPRHNEMKCRDNHYLGKAPC